MRAILNSKPGWRYGVILVLLGLPLGFALRYGIQVHVLARAFTWADVTGTILHTFTFAVTYTLLARAMYRAPRPDQQPRRNTEPPDTP